MAINITQEETWALNILNNAIRTSQQELQRVLSARVAYMETLGIKYDATYNPATGLLVPKEEPKEKKKP